jgi:tetratricopeptide (TPR) repeat protein
MAHRLVGGACAYFGLLTESIDHLGQSLNYAERTGNVLSQVRDHHVLAGAWEEYGDCDKALEHATHALQLARRLGGPVLEGRELNAVGWYLALLGRYEQARVHCAAALTLLRPHTKDGEAATLDSLGYIDTRTGHYAQAVTQFQLALVLRRTRGDSYQVANTLEHLGEAQAALGQHDDARQSWQEALELHQEQHRDADATRIQRQLAGLDRS